MRILKSNSAKTTQGVAKDWAKKFPKEKRGKRALVLALRGDLGSGKTTFIQGFLRALGVRGALTSPTFVLVKSYKLKVKSFSYAYHVDCYRIKESSELLKLGFKEILADPQNIVLIEWAEKIRKLLPRNVVWLKFEHGRKEDQRVIKIAIRKP